MEVSDDLSEPDRNPDDKKLDFCDERRSVTLYKQKRKRNSIALRLLEENTEIATEIDVSVSKEQTVAQQLSSKHKSNPSGCTVNTEYKREDFSRCNDVGNSVYLLILMMDDSTTFQKEQIQDRIMG